MQAIGFLSRREYSRQELRTKLLAAWRRRQALDAARTDCRDADRDRQRQGRGQGQENVHCQEHARAHDQAGDRGHDPGHGQAGDQGHDPDPDRDPDHAIEQEVDTLLDWLQAHGYLSEQRFVESRVHARSARQGLARIRQELAGHGLALEPEQAAALRETEFARARSVWERRFGEVAEDARGRAAQARFLAARGFAADVVRRIVGGDDEF